MLQPFVPFAGFMRRCVYDTFRKGLKHFTWLVDETRSTGIQTLGQSPAFPESVVPLMRRRDAGAFFIEDEVIFWIQLDRCWLFMLKPVEEEVDEEGRFAY